jgi:elongation factor Ts
MPSYIASYVHNDGKLGVLLELQCNDDFSMRTNEFRELARNLTMHIAACNPTWVSSTDVPLEEWEAELSRARPALSGLDTLERQRRLLQLRTQYERGYCLLNQPYVKDDSKSVEALITEVGSKLHDRVIVVRFTRYAATKT